MSTALAERPVPGTPKPVGLALLREPFQAHQISKLPKPFKKDSPKGKCNECGGYHGLPALHLDYVGHAALTDRLLDADINWIWEPVPDPKGLGLPVSDSGMWIRLTVCGVTRLGFGCADGKSGGDAVKEMIGDALRNAAMRFGAALDLWHKGQLHDEDHDGDTATNRNGHEIPQGARDGSRRQRQIQEPSVTEHVAMPPGAPSSPAPAGVRPAVERENPAAATGEDRGIAPSGVLIVKVDESTVSRTNAKPKWFVHFETGSKASTIDRKLAGKALYCMDNRVRVKPTLVPTEKWGDNLTDLFEVSASHPLPEVQLNADMQAHTEPVTDSDIPFVWALAFILPALGMLA